jgi:predicted RNase H-like HicB family nuclease
VASLVDANVNASGDTIQDAVAHLKDLMVALFERLSEEPKSKPGKGPARQLVALRSLMRRKTSNAAHR